MNIINIFKPKWQHKDPTVRLSEILSIDQSETAFLGQIAVSDSDFEVRKAALNALNDLSILKSLINVADDPEIRDQINERIDQFLLHQIETAPDDIAKLNWLQKIEKEQLLLQVAVIEENADIRLQIVELINDQKILAELVTYNCGKAPALSAIEKITDEDVLASISLKGANRSARALAKTKLEEIEANKNKLSPEQVREETISKLTAQVRILSRSSLIFEANQQLQDIRTKWAALDIGPDHPQHKNLEEYSTVIKNRFQELKNQQAREKERALEIVGKHQKLIYIIEQINLLSKTICSDALDQFEQLQSAWIEVCNALAQNISVELCRQYEEACNLFRESRLIIDNEQKNLEILKASIVQAEQLIENDKLDQTNELIEKLSNEIKEWKPLYVKKDVLLLEMDQTAQFYERVKSDIDAELEALKQKNYNNRLALLDKCQQLIETEDIETSIKKFHEIQKTWSKQVELPLNSEEIDTRFQELVDRFSEKEMELLKAKEWQQWQNKILKEKLIEQVNALDNEKDLHKVYRLIKDAQTQWTATGPVPRKVASPLWKQFKTATDRNFIRCKEFFQELDKKAEQNLQLKQEILKQAQELKDSINWQKNAEALKELQAQWKKIGMAPKSKENEVYAAFRNACDYFFERRKTNYKEQSKQKKVNLKKKEDICAKVEDLADAPQASHNKMILEYQSQWKAIGHVGKKHEDEVWKRFRSACDRYYNWLDSLKPDNLKQKEAICLEVEKILGNLSPQTNYQNVSRQIIALQKQWNEIGPIPEEQHKAIWQRFKKPCDSFFESRREYFKIIDQERPQNESRKLEILEKIKNLVKKDSRESAQEIIKRQGEWQAIGPAGKESEKDLQQEYRQLCDSFFNKRRQTIKQSDQSLSENLRKKESLCIRLEMIAQKKTSSPKQSAQSQSLTLAEQLKLAFETNFVLAGDDKDKSRRIKNEITLIQNEWKEAGDVPKEREYTLKKRYQSALSAAKSFAHK